MKIGKFSLLLILGVSLFGEKYYIRHDNEKNIVIINEKHQIISKSLEDFLSKVKKGDTLLFKRGEFFTKPIKIKNKEKISIKDYGSKNLNLPVIDTRYEISANLFEKVDFNDLKKDKSWFFVENELNKNTLVLKSSLQKKVAKSLRDVEDRVFGIYRAKLNFKNIDPAAMRVWLNGAEIIKTAIFEDWKIFKKASWFYDSKNGYLYIFALNQDLKLKSVKINNRYLDSFLIENSKDIKISHLDIRGGKYALSIRGSSDIEVKNSKIGAFSFRGIEIMGGEKGNYSQKVSIKNNVIDSNFKAYYRYISSRGVQDGIFLMEGVRDCDISNNEILNWGHSAINIYSPKGAKAVINNKILSNFIHGERISYMHGITVDGINAIKNEIRFNLIKNITARNQINGIENIFANNGIVNVKNSLVKIDQGYSSAQGVQLQAYGYGNIAKKNVIKENLFMNIDAAGVSFLSLNSDSVKEGNIVSKNIFINCGIKNKNIALEVIDNGLKTIKSNLFLENAFRSKNAKPLIFYRGDILDVDEFNKRDGIFSDKIEGNSILKKEEIKKFYLSPLLKWLRAQDRL